MNGIFSIKRFFLLLRKQFIEQHKLYLMSAVVLTGVLAFMFTISGWSRDSQGTQKFILDLTLIVGGAIFSSMIFRDISDRAHGIFSLTLPASHFEKFLCAWFYGVIFFLPAYLAIFYCMDIAAVNIANSLYNTNNEPLNLDNPYLLNSLLIFMIAQSVAMLGAISFKRWHFIQTAFVAFIVILIILWFDHFMASSFIQAQDVKGGTLFGNISFSLASVQPEEVIKVERFNLKVPEKLVTIMEFAAYLLPLFFWVAAFFKLKEKQL